MTDRPILFSAEMVRAILKGKKTQTRRVIKPQPTGATSWLPHIEASGFYPDKISAKPERLVCKYGQPGDLLWVRETWCAHWGTPPSDAPQSYRIVNGDELPPIKQENGDLYQPTPSDIMTVWYGAEGDKPFHMEWKPSSHMPRWASRITLRITDVRVERLQNITEDDARAEGCDSAAWEDEAGNGINSYRESFAFLWGQIKGPDAWQANPWVWAISFERVKP
jgi:hypothetical protein